MSSNHTNTFNMDQLLTQAIGIQIDAYYNQMTTILLASSSYYNNAKTENVQLYLSFIEASLEKTYGRIVHLYTFLELTERLMIDRMYPFCSLLPNVMESIERIYYQAAWLMEGLDNYDPEAAEALRIEPHEEENV